MEKTRTPKREDEKGEQTNENEFGEKVIRPER